MNAAEGREGILFLAGCSGKLDNPIAIAADSFLYAVVLLTRSIGYRASILGLCRCRGRLSGFLGGSAEHVGGQRVRGSGGWLRQAGGGGRAGQTVPPGDRGPGIRGKTLAGRSCQNRRRAPNRSCKV